MRLAVLAALAGACAPVPPPPPDTSAADTEAINKLRSDYATAWIETRSK